MEKALTLSELFESFNGNDHISLCRYADDLSHQGFAYKLPDGKTVTIHSASANEAAFKPNDSHNLREYIKELNSVEKLTSQLEEALISEGSSDSLSKLVSATLYIVPDIVALYSENYEIDNISDANYAIMEALQHYIDEDVTCGFAVFAALFVRQQVIEYMKEQKINSLNNQQFEKIAEAYTQLKDNGITPTAEILAKAAGINIELAQIIISGLTNSSHEDTAPYVFRVKKALLHKKPGSSDKVFQKRKYPSSLSKELTEKLDKLNDTEYIITDGLFGLSGDKLSPEQLADKLGIDVEKVMSINDSAILKMKE